MDLRQEVQIGQDDIDVNLGGFPEEEDWILIWSLF